jgi:hypothetical protein
VSVMAAERFLDELSRDRGILIAREAAGDQK